jgi:L-serine dehydratase
MNASGGRVVTAPTCGASGVLPAVLYFLKRKYHLSDEVVIEALMVAGLMGTIIRHNASISGAVAGCQAEIGSACSMAAAARGHVFDHSIATIEYASEMAMEHHLGLTCDPILGYVQIPCIERNAMAAVRAIDASRLSYMIPDSQSISFDTVVETMYQTGKDLTSSYRETSLGGLASFYQKRREKV